MSTVVVMLSTLPVLGMPLAGPASVEATVEPAAAPATPGWVTAVLLTGRGV